MPTRNINLTDRYDTFLARQIELGRFKNASEAVRAALHLLECQEREDEARLEALRRTAEIGRQAHARGEVSRIGDARDLDRFFDDIAADVAAE